MNRARVTLAALMVFGGRLGGRPLRPAPHLPLGRGDLRRRDDGDGGGAGQELILQAEPSGLKNLPESHLLNTIQPELVASHVAAFEVTFAASAGIALLGA